MKKIIMFTGAWCQPCQRTKPHFSALKESTTNVECQLVDVDEQEHLAVRYNVRAVPTFVLLNGENEVARMSGMATLEKLKQFINQ